MHPVILAKPESPYLVLVVVFALLGLSFRSVAEESAPALCRCLFSSTHRHRLGAPSPRRCAGGNVRR